MKVQAIGPFQASSAPDSDDLEIVSSELGDRLQSAAPVSGDAKSGNSTEDQENRGFVHILDAVAKEGLKKRAKTARNKDILYSAYANKRRATLRYQSLSDTEETLTSKGINFNKAA